MSGDGPYWEEPLYVSDGETVWLPVERFPDTGKVRVVKCTVAVAAGNHARVVNTEKGIDSWYPLTFLRVPPDDLRHPSRRR